MTCTALICSAVFWLAVHVNRGVEGSAAAPHLGPGAGGGRGPPAAHAPLDRSERGECVREGLTEWLAERVVARTAQYEAEDRENGLLSSHTLCISVCLLCSVEKAW